VIWQSASVQDSSEYR